MFSCCSCKTSKKEKKDEDDSSEESNDKDVNSSNDVEPIKTQIQSPSKNVKADDTSIKTPIPEESPVVNGSLTSSEVDLVGRNYKKMTVNEEKLDSEVRENNEDNLSIERVEIVVSERINETIEEEHIYAEVRKRQVPTINESDKDIENSSVESQEAYPVDGQQKISENKQSYEMETIKITITEDTTDDYNKDDENIISKDQTEAKDEIIIDYQQEISAKNENSDRDNLENSQIDSFSAKGIIEMETNNKNGLPLEENGKELMIDGGIKKHYEEKNNDESKNISEKAEIDSSNLNKQGNTEFEENIYEVIGVDDINHSNNIEKNNLDDNLVEITVKIDCQRNLEMFETAENEENDAENVDSNEVSKCQNEQLYSEGNKDEEVSKITEELCGEKEEENEDEESSPTVSANTIEDTRIAVIPFEPGVIGPPKIGLFEAPAYIERTIVDNLDDDGDDSVFERSSGTDDPSSCADTNHEISKDNKQDFEVNSNQDNVQSVNGDNHTFNLAPNISQHIQNIPEQPIYENISQLINIKKLEESEGGDSTAPERPERSLPRWLSEEDDKDYLEGSSGMQEPPATPVAKDELALRRHRFFSELLYAAQNSTEHRVRFDPLGPMVHPDCDNDREEQLEQLVTRLENVTKRLESVPTKLFAETQEVAVQTLISSSKESEEEILNVIINQKVQQQEEVSFEKELKADSVEFIMSVAGYEDFIAGPLAEYLRVSEKLGGVVAAHSKIVEKAFQMQKEFLMREASHPLPMDQQEQVIVLGPTSVLIQQVQEFRSDNRDSKLFNHLSAISESIQVLGWVVSPTPASYVKQMSESGQFYAYRVLSEWKEEDKTHAEWCKAWLQTLAELHKYVLQHHQTGINWKKGGSAPIPPPPGNSAPIPPPPCMPLGDVSAPVGNDRSALFAQINQGENITKSLKKVTSEMQTHKNPSLRTGPAPFKAPVVRNVNSPMKTTVPASAPIDDRPVFTRDGKKWLVEYLEGKSDLLVENAEMNNVVYMYRCKDCTLNIKGKINSVVMDSCRKSYVVFDSLVSSIEFINCQSVQMQVLGKVPTISIDKTDGCQMYLSPESLQVELITSKSSEMNVMIPRGNGDYTEYPVPEQFKTLVSPKGLSTTAVDSLG